MDISNFIKNFKLDTNGLFHNPVPLKDVELGFSVIREVGSTGWASIFYIYVSNEDLHKKGDLKSLTIRVSHGKLEKDTDGLLFISLDDKDKLKKVTGPINLISKNEYFYDIKSNIFYKYKTIIEANKLLNEIYQVHQKPTRLLAGFGLRFKLLFWRVIIPSIVNFSTLICRFLLYLISGAKFEDTWIERFNPNELNNVQKNKGSFTPEKMDLFGFKAQSWPITFYCVFHLSFYILFWYLDYKPSFIITIFKNSFLTLIYVVASLVFLDRWLPSILKLLIKKTSNLYLKLSTKSINI